MEEIDLTSFFQTKAQADDFLVRLSNIAENLYETGFNLEKALIEHFGIEKKDKLMVFLRENSVSMDSPSSLKEFFDKLTDKISKIPTLSLGLAFQPKEETLNLINEWLMLNIKKQFVFDIAVNKGLIAGITINFNGKYHDYSIKQRYEKILKDIFENQSKTTIQQTAHST